ncbi:MAG: sulfotransferase [Cyanobacteria bacterium P01_D01_bin.115]
MPNSLRIQIRLWKNHWIKQYLNYRLAHNSDPLGIAFRKKPYRVLWILSHMRSGSSLLTHILNTNPAIAGYGESHISYKGLQDFKSLISRVYWSSQEYRNLRDLQKLSLHETYILDKLLHNNKLVDISLLQSDNVFVIFLVREPRRSLNSIRDLKPDWSEEKTLHHYCDRLKELVHYAESMSSSERALLLRHDQLIEHSPQVFEALQDFLGTEIGFSEKYQILKTTGAKHVGDSKGDIRAGQIMRTQRELKETISQEYVDQAQVVYQDCCDRLSKLASVIDMPMSVS